jgi:hypothetical protein
VNLFAHSAGDVVCRLAPHRGLPDSELHALTAYLSEHSRAGSKDARDLLGQLINAMFDRTQWRRAA